jgi:putative FmdB family regulatory protein
MPVYEHHCNKCKRQLALRLSISEHEKGRAKCPTWGGEEASTDYQFLHVSNSTQILTTCTNQVDPQLGCRPRGRPG